MKKNFLFFLFLFLIQQASSQRTKNPVYIDKQGIMRWASDGSEASFFGVNYTVPFAYGYRSHMAQGVELEHAIDADVHHMARLGLNAFRVHVWDVDISDSLGNLLNNEHLRLFDYLINKLKEYDIKILITPIAFWGNGYPEPDVKTSGFSYVYGKSGAVVNEKAIRAQEYYLKQFFSHVNPYTGLTYKDDPDVIAMEINNEPHHSGPKEKTTEYINRMVAAVKSTGWTKPIFYNISESYRYADAIAKAKVNGHSFQWYPTGLVANHERKGNYLPHVNTYHIPFDDTIPAFRNRALMVYEFDAGDVMQPIMYPAMARSYRAAGFQWATQFAYDPLYTAYGNTEYQTHYVNLVYTPAKAISLLIASKAFLSLPLKMAYGIYPADTAFGVFRVSYHEQLAEMNSPEEFYYTGNTSTQPQDLSELKHIAGTGNSVVVNYEGTGAYFLDKRADGQWKLEVMPDAIAVSDPFERASPKKEVVKIAYQVHRMKVRLPDLGEQFSIRPLNEGSSFTQASFDGSFGIRPGVYLLVSDKIEGRINTPDEWKKYFAPPPSLTEPVLLHEPLKMIGQGQSFSVNALIAGIDSLEQIILELRPSSGQWKSLDMQHAGGYNYTVRVSPDAITSGINSYRILVRTKNGEMYTFPGGYKGDPYAWDAYRNETWSTMVVPSAQPLELFHASRHRQNLMIYNTDWRNNRIEYPASANPMQVSIRTTMTRPETGKEMAWQHYFGEEIKGRINELDSFLKIVIRVRSNENAKARITLITSDADAYSGEFVAGQNWEDIEILLKDLKPSDFYLLPRPYPGFQPLKFRPVNARPLMMQKAEKLEIAFSGETGLPVSLEVESIRLVK